MTTKTFWIPWHPNDSYIDFSKLKAEEIGVLMQIVNLIYIKQRPIENDPHFIGKNCNIQQAKCRKIISKLIERGDLFFTENGEIFQKRCESVIKEIQEKREYNSKNGKKGAEKRWDCQQDQEDGYGPPVTDDLAKYKTKPKKKYY
ncbi:MAG: DUF1376 domain-containing protein [Alphaproteobacteria bacterium]|nr:DUF1376 domain-containing protein [Alphaproteobacteria bacterium]